MNKNISDIYNEEVINSVKTDQNRKMVEEKETIYELDMDCIRRKQEIKKDK